MSRGWRMVVAYLLWLGSLALFFVFRDGAFVPLVASFAVFMPVMRWATREEGP